MPSADRPMPKARAGRYQPDRAGKAEQGRHDRRDVVRLFVGAGREAGIRPADLVGAITNEAGLTSKELGGIEIAGRFSLVEVPAEKAEDVISAMRRAKLRGQKVTVRRDRDA